MLFNSVLISVTEVCTVGCRHCGFRGSTRDREPTETELVRWVGEVCEYRVPKIIFTGGEPFQRFHLLRAAVEAAMARATPPDIACFTSASWGSSPIRVSQHLEQLRGLNQLYLSTDVYHQERVPWRFVANVIEG